MNVIPNSFQTPNAVIDQLMPLLTDSEFRVLMFAVRHILGWHDKFAERRGPISLSAFGRCGLGRGAVSAALKTLTDYRILERIGKPGKHGQMWQLRFMTRQDTDFEGLQKRRADKANTQQKRTVSARQNNPNNAPTGQSDRPEVVSGTDQQVVSPTDQQVVSPTDQKWSVAQTSRGQSDRPLKRQIQKQEETQGGIESSLISSFESLDSATPTDGPTVSATPQTDTLTTVKGSPAPAAQPDWWGAAWGQLELQYPLLKAECLPFLKLVDVDVGAMRFVFEAANRRAYELVVRNEASFRRVVATIGCLRFEAVQVEVRCATVAKAGAKRFGQMEMRR